MSAVALSESIRTRLDKGGDLCIAALGDSLTHGWLVRRGYFLRACDALEARTPALRLQRIGAGVPGDTAFGGLGRVDALLAREPALVLIQFGLNDCFSGEQVGVYQRHLGRLVHAVRAVGAQPVLVTSCPLEGNATMAVARPFYQAMRVLGSTESVLVADTTAHWLRVEAQGESPAPLWQPDGVHPTDAGHALMARGLVEALLSAGGLGCSGARMPTSPGV